MIESSHYDIMRVYVFFILCMTIVFSVVSINLADALCTHDPNNYNTSCDNTYLSPLKQLQNGIPFTEIQCKAGLTILQKYDGSIACVQEQTKQKLIERKWITIEDDSPVFNSLPTFDYKIKTQTVSYGSQYQISEGIVDDITYYEQSNSLIVSLGKSERGNLRIVLPIGLLHESNREAPFVYFVTVDDQLTKFEKFTPVLLGIPFEDNAKQIVITGVSVVS